MKSVLFVCLGNICRSPMAQGVMEHFIETRGLKDKLACDSAGTGSWHTGELPDRRTLATLRSKGVALNHRARTLSPRDFQQFDLVLTMDSDIHRQVLRVASESDRKKVRMYRDFDPAGAGDLEDPYYGTQADFEEVWTICERTTPVIADYLLGSSYVR